VISESVLRTFDPEKRGARILRVKGQSTGYARGLDRPRAQRRSLRDLCETCNNVRLNCDVAGKALLSELKRSPPGAPLAITSAAIRWLVKTHQNILYEDADEVGVYPKNLSAGLIGNLLMGVPMDPRTYALFLEAVDLRYEDWDNPQLMIPMFQTQTHLWDDHGCDKDITLSMLRNGCLNSVFVLPRNAQYRDFWSNVEHIVQHMHSVGYALRWVAEEPREQMVVKFSTIVPLDIVTSRQGNGILLDHEEQKLG